MNISKGKTDMDSFKFVSHESLENLKILETQATTNCESLENIINDKFYETLVNKIKNEVKNAISERSSLNAYLNANSINAIRTECENEADRK